MQLGVMEFLEFRKIWNLMEFLELELKVEFLDLSSGNGIVETDFSPSGYPLA